MFLPPSLRLTHARPSVPLTRAPIPASAGCPDWQSGAKKDLKWRVICAGVEKLIEEQGLKAELLGRSIDVARCCSVLLDVNCFMLDKSACVARCDVEPCSMLLAAVACSMLLDARGCSMRVLDARGLLGVAQCVWLARCRSMRLLGAASSVCSVLLDACARCVLLDACARCCSMRVARCVLLDACARCCLMRVHGAARCVCSVLLDACGLLGAARCVRIARCCSMRVARSVLLDACARCCSMRVLGAARCVWLARCCSMRVACCVWSCISLRVGVLHEATSSKLASCCFMLLHVERGKKTSG